MQTFNRGETIDFLFTFYNSSDDVTIPEGAELTIDYPSTGWPMNGESLTKTTVAMTLQSTVTGSWLGTWESAVSQPGQVYYSIISTRSTGTADYVGTDGVFRLTGNFANLERST